VEIERRDVRLKSTLVSSAASSSAKEVRMTADASKLEEKLPGSRKGAKKTAVSRTVSTEAAISQREEARRWAATGTGSETSIVGGSVEGEMPTKTGIIIEALTVEASMVYTESADSLYVQEYMAAQYPPVEEVVSSTVRLGRALVSGALGMSTDDPKLFETAIRLPECSVVIRSTKRKARAPVSAPPPNSLDSEMDINESTDVQLSQSATDVGVQIELPGLGIEALLQEILAKEDVTASDKPTTTEAPPTPGLIATPDLSTVKRNKSGVQHDESGCEISGERKASGECKIVKKGELTALESQRILEEIESSKVLREELRKQDLSLASASSFLNVVCGGASKSKGSQKTGELQSTSAGNEGGVIAELTKEQLEAKYVEKQRVANIMAAKPLVEEEVAKAEPSWALAVASRPVVGEDVASAHSVVEEQVALSATPTTVNTLVPDAPVAGTTPTRQSRAVIELQAESPLIISDDAPMSIGDSEEEGSESDGSDGFSPSGSGISRGDSNRGDRGSRKRPADESPERKLGEVSRREFPGLITRSEGGCRIYVPPTEKKDGAYAMCGTEATADVCPISTTDDAPKSEMPNATHDANMMYATMPKFSMCATGATRTPCSRDAATAMIGTQVVLSTAATTAVDTPTRDQSMFEIDVDRSTTLMYPAIRQSSPPVPDIVILDVASEPDTRPQIHPIQVTGTPILITGEVSSLASGSLPGITGNATAGLRIPLATEGWGRDAQMVEGLFQIMEGMEPPWITVNVLEAAAVRFPNVDRESLRLTIMTMMMTQRRCLVRLTRAGLRRGPRIDQEGNSFIELDLDYADRYSTSH